MHAQSTLTGGKVPAHVPGAYPSLSCCGGPILLVPAPSAVDAPTLRPTPEDRAATFALIDAARERAGRDGSAAFDRARAGLTPAERGALAGYTCDICGAPLLLADIGPHYRAEHPNDAPAVTPLTTREAPPAHSGPAERNAE